MTALPSVEPLTPGTRPTEPGWYVCRGSYGPNSIMKITILEGQPYADGTGQERYEYVGMLTFIARVYPDRIRQE